MSYKKEDEIYSSSFIFFTNFIFPLSQHLQHPLLYITSTSVNPGLVLHSCNFDLEKFDLCLRLLFTTHVYVGLDIPFSSNPVFLYTLPYE